MVATAAPTSRLRRSSALGVSVHRSTPRLRSRALQMMTRGAVMTIAGHLASLARPVAIAWFARLYGTRSLGGFLLLWACVELGGRFATLGIDRGVQRWTDDRRPAAAIAGMVLAAASALGVVAVLVPALPYFAALNVDALPAARVVLLVALPLTAIGNVALRAARGEAQIATYVVARGVTEPLIFLVAGLALSVRYPGTIALPVALMISIAAGAVVAAVGVVRAFGVRRVVATLARPSTWPVRELLRSSLPLGVSDVLQSLQAKLDLVVVAILTVSAHHIASYGIAAEIAGVFVALRVGFDQVVAPVATESRDDRGHLVEVLTTAIRWSAVVAAVIAFAIVVTPEALLRWFGGSEDAVLVLLVLVAGRAIEMILAPAASMLAVVGEPRLSLLDTAVSVGVSLLGQLTAACLGLGPVAIAAASSAGVIASSVLAVYWLARLEAIAPSWFSTIACGASRSR
jgi:hypothetical protein